MNRIPERLRRLRLRNGWKPLGYRGCVDVDGVDGGLRVIPGTSRELHEWLEAYCEPHEIVPPRNTLVHELEESPRLLDEARFTLRRHRRIYAQTLVLEPTEGWNDELPPQRPQ